MSIDPESYHSSPEPTDLHEARLQAVLRALRQCGARSVVDLGCGPGLLLERLAREAQFQKLAGLDASSEALGSAERSLGARALLVHGSFTARHERLAGFEAAVMLETIEHIDPRQLSALEHALFRRYRPATVIITTPNREYNALYGMGEDELRHPEHHFEWTRARFRGWTRGVAERQGYEARFEGIGDEDWRLGTPTQMAIFSRSSHGAARMPAPALDQLPPPR